MSKEKKKPKVVQKEVQPLKEKRVSAIENYIKYKGGK